MTTTAKAAEAHFRAVAPKYMTMFMEDFYASDLDAAAVFGNSGYESRGFTTLQEIKPVVKGSRGGWGWFQWTGERRRAFEAYCARNGFDPASDEANYKFLFVELIGTEKGALAKLKAAKTLEAKVKAFELAFERAGVKNYAERNRWARIALDALHDAAAEPVQPPIEDYEQDIAPAPSRPSAPSWLALAVIAGLAVLVGAAVFFGGQASTGAEVSLLEAPIPHDRPLGLLGGDAGGNLWADIGMQIALAFVMPLVSAAATAAVGWIVYWWQRVLKAEFDAKSRLALHEALERGIMAAIEAFGPRMAASKTGKSKLLEFAADYAATNNPGAVKHFGLAFGDLERLAVPHLVSARKH